MKQWQMQEAKARFAELIEEAERNGPQTVTKHGKPRAVVMSSEQFAAMQKGKAPRLDFVNFLLSIPKSDDGFDIERDKDTGREIDLG
jgi:prevent-host-death family protein